MKLSSSIGTKLRGVLVMSQIAVPVISSTKPAPSHFFRAKKRTPLMYLPVKLSNPELNAVKKRLPNPIFFLPSVACVFFNNSAHNAGVRVSALTAEMMMAMANV
ncbi:hypothetical protein D9M68_761490 [compost metagenome]